MWKRPLASFSNLCLVLGALASSTVSVADELRMKNGSIIIGELVRVSDGKVIFDTPFAGKIKIDQANIERITTKDPVTLKMADGAVFEDKQIISTETAMLVKTEGEKSVIFAAEDIEMVNPELWELGEGYDWSGRIGVVVEFENGNSDTQDWDFDFKTTWQSIYDRYVLDGSFEYETAKKVKKEENWDLGFKYDRFLEPRSPNYRGVKILLFHDEFQDLNLRTVLSPYVGRQFLNESHLSLSGEIGGAYVNENFDIADDEQWFGLLWNGDASSDFLGHGITVFVDHEGIVRVEDPSNLILNTVLGLRYPLTEHLELSLEAELEYDGGAPDTIEKMDETYNVKLGYVW